VGTAALLEYLIETEGSIEQQFPDEDEGMGSSSNAATPEFALCLGADTFLDLIDGKWRESGRVLDLIQGRILVFYRPPSSSTSTSSVADAESGNALKRRKQERFDLLQRRVDEVPNARLLRVDGLEDISSSQVRSCTDVSELRRMVVPGVLEYMRQHKLYAAFSD